MCLVLLNTLAWCSHTLSFCLLVCSRECNLLCGVCLLAHIHILVNHARGSCFTHCLSAKRSQPQTYPGACMQFRAGAIFAYKQDRRVLQKDYAPRHKRRPGSDVTGLMQSKNCEGHKGHHADPMYFLVDECRSKAWQVQQLIG